MVLLGDQAGRPVTGGGPDQTDQTPTDDPGLIEAQLRSAV